MLIEKYFGIDYITVQTLISATSGLLAEKTGDNGFQNTKVFLIDEYAVLKMQNIDFRNVITKDHDLKHFERIANELLELLKQGVNVMPILAFTSDNGNGYVIQAKAKGAELYDRHRMNENNYVLKQVKMLSDAPQKHFDKFVADVVAITNTGILIDFIGKDNFFYDEKIGFQFIDLNAHYDYVYGSTAMKPPTELIACYGCFLPCYYDTMPQFRDTVSTILPQLTDDERNELFEFNKTLSKKCKAALINNGITAEMIDNTFADERFIPQKRQVNII